MQGFFIPLEQLLNSILYLYFMRPAKRVELTHIDEFAHGAIGLSGIELYSSLETNGFHNEF